MSRIVGLLPLLPAFLLVGMSSRSMFLPVILTAVVLLMPRRQSAEAASAIVPMAIAGAAGFLINQQFAELRELPAEHAAYQGIADNLGSVVAALAAAAAVRRRWSKPEGGEALTLGLVFFCIALAAFLLPRWVIAVALAWVVLFSMLTLPEARHAISTPRSRLRTGIALLLAAGVATCLAALLPWLQARTVALIEAQIAGAATGLGDHIALGYQTDITPSDAPVLRLYVEPRATSRAAVDHLRGYVFTHYWRGQWLPPKWPVKPRRQSRSAAPANATVELAAASTRVLLPLESADLTTPTRGLGADGTGVPIAERPIDGYSFRAGARGAFPIAKPEGDDLFVPADVRRELEPVAEAWTRGAVSAEEQLSAMVRVLRHDYRWSLQSRRASRSDPVVDFVLRERVGHCEYFASAMALVARIRGIPARVVGGYRVAEYNPLGKNYVVRESNAHAWVEAWVEGRGWQSYDPTPDASVNALREQGFFAALIDLARARPSRAILVMSALVIVVALALSLRARLGGPLARADEPTLPNLAKLVGAIARRTRKRAPGETLLEWAHEVALPEEVALLERYTAVRWGGAPDVGAVEEDAARLARQTRSGGSGGR